MLKSDIIYVSSKLHMQENTMMKENMNSLRLLEKIVIRSAPPNSTTESILSSTLLLYFMQQGKQVNEFLGLYLTSNEPG